MPSSSLTRSPAVRRPRSRFRAALWPLLALLIGSLASLAVGIAVHQRTQADSESAFHRQVDRLQSDLARSFERPQHALNAMVGFYNASRSVERAEFDAYWEHHDIGKEFPGVRSLGFIEPVKRENLAAFIAREKADGLTDYVVQSQGEDPELLLVRHAISDNGTRAALGIDINPEPQRRAAAVKAIGTGQVTLSNPIQIKTEGSETLGFLMLQPVYRSGADPTTYAQRRAALVGLVYSAILAHDIMKPAMGDMQGLVDFDVFDGVISSGAPVVFSSSPQAARAKPRFEQDRIMEIAGLTLTVRAHSTPSFEALQDHSRAGLVGTIGMLFTLAVVGGFWLLTRGREAAENRATRIAHENDRLAKVVQLTNNSVLITDAQGHIEWVNPAFTRLSGYSLEEARGRNAAELRRIETTDPVAFATIRFATEQGQNVRLQAHYQSRDGQDYWLDQDIQILRDKQGQITGSMAIETDITAEKRAGETLEVALNETAALMNTINIHSIVSETDVAGRILHANHAFEVISGYTRDELIGQNHRIVNSGVHPPEFWKNMWKTISSGEPWRGEVCNRTKDGELYWVDNVIAPFLDGRGRITKYVSVRTDITASKRYQASLQEARAKAEEATRSKGQFLANMSHEIRTPMNAILGMLSLLQKTKLDSRQADYANKTEGAARSLLGLLNDILDFSKVEAGKMTLDLQPFRLDRLLRDLSVILSSNVGAKNVEVLFDIDPTVPKLLLGDALRLQQVLINLGGNAVKFTAQGQVVISIRRPTVAAPPDTLVFAVQDSGIGIAPENQAHIFSGFSQAEASTSRRFGGTGLGLAISQRLVEVMGGQLQLHSVLGEGSTFSFAIALPPVEASTDALQLPPPVSVAPRHVLVVDDNAVAGELMVAMARSWNWTADLVSGGEDAIAYVRAKLADGAPGAPLPCQVVFLDWHMAPGLDGWETARQIRSLCQAHATPPPALIMVTGQGRETLSQRTEEEQSWLHGFLVKPVTASMLLDAVLDADAPRSTVRQDTVRASQRRLNGLRLLVVEDNLINQQVAEELLNSEGAQVSLAANGQLGVEAVLAAHPQFDAVLMDVQMPVLDGYAATRALRTDAALANLPIIAMTANAMATDREACLQAGMNDHIGKPFDLNELVALLQRFVDLPTADATASLDGRPPLHEALPPTPGVDLQVALARLSGNRSLYLRTAHDFLRTRTTAVAALEQALQAGEFGQATLQLHTLKGIAGTLGLTALAQTAGHLEKRCPQEAWQAAADFATELGALADTLQADCAALQAAMSHLQPASAHDAPHPAALADADVPASRARVQAALAALLPLLAHEDFEVLERFAELQPDLQGLTPSELEPLETALQNLEWQEAYVLCQALISRND